MADDALTHLQHAVLGLFFGLPQSDGFVLAGGAGAGGAGSLQCVDSTGDALNCAG